MFPGTARDGRTNGCNITPIAHRAVELKCFGWKDGQYYQVPTGIHRGTVSITRSLPAYTGGQKVAESPIPDPPA